MAACIAGPLQQPKGQTSVFYSVPPPLPPAEQLAAQEEAKRLIRLTEQPALRTEAVKAENMQKADAGDAQ